MESNAFVELVSRQIGKDKEEVQSLIDGMSEVIKEKCSNMDSIAIPGFGLFEPRKKLERVSVNPATGLKMLVPPKISLSFKQSAILKQKVNG